MKIKFTKASKTDKTLVTVALAQFDGTDFDIHRGLCIPGEEITITIDGVPTIFFVNRFRGGKAATAVSYGFPRHLRLPTVGRHTTANVSEVC